MSKKDKKNKEKKEKRMSGKFNEKTIHISEGNSRQYLHGVYVSGGGFGNFKGIVSKINKDKGILFKCLYVEYMQGDGSFVKGKEDHIWTYDTKPFEDSGVKVGDKVSFSGLVYAYKRRDGARDYGIKAFSDIEIIGNYANPSKKHLKKQSMEEVVCDSVCLYKDRCYGMCVAPNGWKEEMIKMLIRKKKKAKAS